MKLGDREAYSRLKTYVRHNEAKAAEKLQTILYKRPEEEA